MREAVVLGESTPWELDAPEFGHLPEELSIEERALADRLIPKLIESIKQLGMFKRTGAKMAAHRLVHKLKTASLKDDSVGVIAERVWWRLMKVSGLGDGIPPDSMDANCSGDEAIIAEDIIHKAESAYLLIRDTWKEIAREAGPGVSSKVIHRYDGSLAIGERCLRG